MARIATVAALSILALVSTAEAQTIVSAENPAELVTIIQDLGFQAKLEKDNVGDPVIRSSSNGVEFGIYFYECKGNKRCKSLHFSVGYDLVDGASLDTVQQWNADKRFTSAYLDDDGDPFLQMDINTEGGITQQNFEKSFGLWQTLKGEFEQFIDFHAQPRVSSTSSQQRGA